MPTFTAQPLTTALTNQKSIDVSKVSPYLGVNIKLTDSTDPDKFYVGTILTMHNTIMNADGVGLYNRMDVSGIDNAGVKRNVTITLEDLENNVYGEYDRFFYTEDMEEQENANIYVEHINTLVVDDAVVHVWSEHVVVGNLIAFMHPDGSEYKGIITEVPATGDRIAVETWIGGRLTNVRLTLVQATEDDFRGGVVAVSYL